MTPPVPPRVDRATLDRILQRAAELQSGSGDATDSMSADEIVALGKDVGLSESYLRQAMLEAQASAGLPAANGFLDNVLGRADVAAERVIQGALIDISAALTQALDRQEHFTVQRGTPELMSYEPMEGFSVAMRKFAGAFGKGRSKPYLDQAELLTALITPLDAGFCHVRLVASLRKSRSGYAVGMGIAAATGPAGVFVLTVMGASIPLAALALLPGAFIAMLVARSFPAVPARAQVGLDRILDELQRHPPIRGEALPPPPRAALGGVGKIMRDITEEVRKAIDK